jgi:hypothetical protein
MHGYYFCRRYPKMYSPWGTVQTHYEAKSSSTNSHISARSKIYSCVENSNIQTQLHHIKYVKAYNVGTASTNFKFANISGTGAELGQFMQK